MQRDCGLRNPLNTKIDMKVLGVNNCWAASIFSRPELSEAH
jgi:hypothetical protein